MLLTGPFAVTANQSTTLLDPSTSSGSVAVQIQNGSSYSLTVTTLGRKFDIGANTAATVPAYNGSPIMLTAGASGASGAGVSALWLYPGEFNPQHDGAIPSITTSPPATVGEIVGTDFYATGLPGATTGARFVGGTISGPPLTGTFSANDFVVDNAGNVWVCTAGGSPGTWWQVGAPNTPAPLTTGTIIQSYTDPTGEIWVAKNGVNAGAWRRARDVLHARVYRNAAWTWPNGSVLQVFDTVVSDPYSLYGLLTTSVFTIPVTGLWVFQSQNSANSVAGNHQATLLQQGANVLASGANSESITAFVTTVAYTEEILTAGQTVQVNVSGGAGVPAGVPGRQYSYAHLRYSGTG